MPVRGETDPLRTGRIRRQPTLGRRAVAPRSTSKTPAGRKTGSSPRFTTSPCPLARIRPGGCALTRSRSSIPAPPGEKSRSSWASHWRRSRSASQSKRAACWSLDSISIARWISGRPIVFSYSSRTAKSHRRLAIPLNHNENVRIMLTYKSADRASVGLAPAHSHRNAAIGSIRAARRAGK